MTKTLTYHQIEEIEGEIKELKRELASEKNITLAGLWKNISVDESDFKEAKESLFESGA